MLSKLKQKIKEGFLRDLIAEMRWIWGYARRYRRGIALYVLLGVAATVLGLGNSVASKYLIDAVVGHQDSLILTVAAIYVNKGENVDSGKVLLSLN